MGAAASGGRLWNPDGVGSLFAGRRAFVGGNWTSGGIFPGDQLLACEFFTDRLSSDCRSVVPHLDSLLPACGHPALPAVPVLRGSRDAGGAGVWVGFLHLYCLSRHSFGGCRRVALGRSENRLAESALFRLRDAGDWTADALFPPAHRDFPGPDLAGVGIPHTPPRLGVGPQPMEDGSRLTSSHLVMSYAV